MKVVVMFMKSTNSAGDNLITVADAVEIDLGNGASVGLEQGLLRVNNKKASIVGGHASAHCYNFHNADEDNSTLHSKRHYYF